ncbi:MAG: carbamoyl-phosphate synthase large subunit, partial [Nanoarchaeota archaeon]|nr:carbamoyl-phosphate synthase large subunit [Nanoarchaeota archaeon]
DKIARLTNIDKWFLHKIKNIVEVNKELAKYNIKTIPKELLKQAKMLGFSDAQIGKQIIKEKVSLDKKSLRVRRLRKSKKIFPFIKQIDTLAGEYPAKTNYLYLTYNGSEDDITIRNDESIVILGSGAYKIGNSVEFDWCCVNCTLTLSKLGYKTIMINYNPETVSTDYDICDRLYFEELTLERVLDIYEKENPQGVVVSMGGQIPNNLALRLHEQRVKILGTAPKSIDNAEDRHKFSKLLDELNVDQPPWKELTNMKTIKNVAEKFGYPILIRPSYILSGSAMSVASNEDELKRFLKKASLISKEHPVVITKFLTGAKEIEIDAVANKGDIICYAISEHVENAGVHSGDATLVTPPQRLYHETVRRIKKITRMIAKSLDITGPFNIQYLAKDNEIKVIECNLRASRSFPFVSKVYNVNFIDLATRAIMGRHVRKIQNTSFDLDYVGVKAPQFSFTRLRGADPILGVEMASTGEVACFGDDIFEAFLKAILSTGFKIPKKSILLSTGTLKEKGEFIESAKKLVSMGYKLFATSGTSKFLDNQKINNTLLHWPLEDKKPNALDYITNLKVDLVINIPKSNESEELSNDYIIRRTAVDFSIPIITNIKCANLFVKSISKKNAKDLQIKSWDEYL